MPLISVMPGSSTSASKIELSPVDGLKKMYLTPAALSCATNRAPPVPRIGRTAPAGAAAGALTCDSDCAIDLAATVLSPTALRPDMRRRREIP